jgi:cyclopropane-fatty-acyl-phospholipid synthase
MNTAAVYLPLSWPMRLLERGLLPDVLVRFGIRRLLKARLAEENQGTAEAQQRHLMKLIARLRQSPIAIDTAAANLQHYELPCAFFELVLGRHLKYSSGYYPTRRETLDEAEAAMLRLTTGRARPPAVSRILK